MRAFLCPAILLLCVTTAPLASATDHEQNCKDEGDRQAKQCEATGKGAEGANTGQAQGIGNSMPGKQINIGAQGQKQSALDSMNKLNAANKSCEANKQQCSSKCDSEASQADADAAKAQAQDPMHQCNAQCMQYKQQASDIRSHTKSDSCLAPIAAMQKELSDGANEAQQAANGDNGTKGQSAGLPPIPPAGGSSPSPSPTPTPTPAADLMSQCTDPSSATLASCTKTLVDKCTPGLASNETTDPTCDTFTMRYCNTTPAGGDTQFSGTAVPPQGQSRAGEGVGTPYCNTAIAKNFCQDPGRSQCATCQNYRNQFSDACKQNPASCAPTQFSSSCPTTEPPIATMPPSGTTPVSGIGMGTGGGGGDLMPGTGTATNGERYSTASIAKEGQSAASKMDMAVSEGGGGGGGGSDYNSKDDDFASRFRKKLDLLTAPKSVSANASRSPTSVDVSGGTGPSLFYISSTTIQNLCARDRLRHCGKAD